MPKATTHQLQKLDAMVLETLLDKLEASNARDGRYTRAALKYLRHNKVIADKRGRKPKSQPETGEAANLAPSRPLGDQYDT